MKARDAISLVRKSTADTSEKHPSVAAGMPLLDVLPRLLESPTRQLKVYEAENHLGVIDSDSLLEALSRQIAPRYDCSIIELECAPQDYSASILARAVEDTDAHLVDLLTSPMDEGLLRVTLRIRCEDPSAAAHSLERYGYNVLETHGNDHAVASASLERLLGLQALINV